MTRDELLKTIAAREAGSMPDQRATTEQLRDLVDVANILGLYDAADAVRMALARRLPAPTRPLVFAIRPEFCDRIFAGPDADQAKGWEFRTRAPSLAPGEVFLIYKTAPVSMVVGYARRGQLLISDPATIWTVTDPLQGIARSDYDAYFDGREKAVAIEVVDATLFDEPLALPAGMSAPQSWSRWKGDWPLAGVPC